jgi:GNAT superfamily N-acetyltransferase
VNVHDVVVLASHRGKRVAQRMFARVEEEARSRGACKLTLEVLSGNQSALLAYKREGFANYQLDPAFGAAMFLQKKL